MIKDLPWIFVGGFIVLLLIGVWHINWKIVRHAVFFTLFGVLLVEAFAKEFTKPTGTLPNGTTVKVTGVSTATGVAKLVSEPVVPAAAILGILVVLVGLAGFSVYHSTRTPPPKAPEPEGDDEEEDSRDVRNPRGKKK